MKLTESLLENIERLLAGESVASGSLRGKWVETFRHEGVLIADSRKSRIYLRAPNPDVLMQSLHELNEAFTSIDNARAILNGENLSRAELVELSGNSKTRNVRAMPGFAVNSYEPIHAELHGRPMVIMPPKGSFVFISDWREFVVPSDILIVGIENMENFREIRKQKYLFERLIDKQAENMNSRDAVCARSILFVARYPQSGDLGLWLERIPNRYVHFGDLDLAGIAIYMNEISKHVGTRGTFLIPDDAEARLHKGSRQRYKAQESRYATLHTPDPALRHLIDLIRRLGLAYDQEGYICD